MRTPQARVDHHGDRADEARRGPVHVDEWKTLDRDQDVGRGEDRETRDHISQFEKSTPPPSGTGRSA
jgi:hypothetical protein